VGTTTKNRTNYRKNRVFKPGSDTEAESKEKHDIWDPSLCGLRVDSNTITTGNPMPKLTLSVRDVGFGLRAACGNRVSHKNMNPSLTCPFSLFISVAITNLFRDHTPAVLLPLKRTMKCRVVSKNIWVILHGRRNHIIEIKFSRENFSY
jgi:hypothetical protein